METFSTLLAFCAVNSPVLPVNSPHKGQWRGALMFSLICACTNGCANNRDAGDLRRHRAHYSLWRHCNGNKDIPIHYIELKVIQTMDRYLSMKQSIRYVICAYGYIFKTLYCSYPCFDIKIIKKNYHTTKYIVLYRIKPFLSFYYNPW